jgi:hypothetical protein
MPVSSQLQMDSGTGYVKPAIVGTIALLFAGGIYAMSQSGDKTTAGAEPSAPSQAEAAAGGAAAAPVSAAAATPAPASPATADMQVSAPAPSTAVATPAATAAPVETASAATAPADTAIAEPEPNSAQAERAAPADEHQDRVAKKDSKPSRPAVRSPAPAASDALRPWWNQTASNDRFGVQYVGQAAGQPTLVIRFSQQVTDPSAQQNIKLIGADGQAVAATWEAGQDPRVLVAPNLRSGRYTVVIDPQLASINGESLGTQLRGPTYIQ